MPTLAVLTRARNRPICIMSAYENGDIVRQWQKLGRLPPDKTGIVASSIPNGYRRIFSKSLQSDYVCEWE